MYKGHENLEKFMEKVMKVMEFDELKGVRTL